MQSWMTSAASPRLAAMAVTLGVWLAAGSAAPYQSNPMGPPVKLDPVIAKRGAEIYAGVCSACHEQGLNRAPQRGMLNLMTPESIDFALTEGVMRGQAAALSPADKRAVAQFIAGRELGARITAPLVCKAGTADFDLRQPAPFTGWGLTPENTHAISTRAAGLGRSAAGRLRLKWSLAFPNAVRARSQPAVAGGLIFVGSQDGTVFALDRRSGCARWTFRASAEVRTGIVVSPWRAGDTAAQPRLYFGDVIGNVYAVKARTGGLVWKQKPDPHPSATITASPVLEGDQLLVPVSSLEEGRSTDPNYGCCTFRGSVVAYQAATGKVNWQTFMTDPPVVQGVNAAGAKRYGPSGVALWNSPAIDHLRGRLYIATGDNYSTPTSDLSDSVLALDLKTGAVVWSYQALGKDGWTAACGAANKANCPPEDGPDFDFGAAAILAHASDGRDLVLAGAKSGVVFAIDPDTGKLIWTTKVGRGGVIAGIHFGMAAVGDRLFVPVSDVPDGKTYPDPAKPGMYALDIKTGAFLWQTPAPDVCHGVPFCHPGYAAAITATPQLVVAGSDDGHLRTYDAASGKVLWDYDTLREFKTVNGAVAHGGAMGGGAAPILDRGLLVTNSGYGFAAAMAGNVLLVFEAK
jgi:polyvinyl alcohol dehydrogenase (cytochrome)